MRVLQQPAARSAGVPKKKKKLSRLRAPFLIFSAARAPSFFSPSSDRPLRRLLSLSLLRHITPPLKKVLRCEELAAATGPLGTP